VDGRDKPGHDERLAPVDVDLPLSDTLPSNCLVDA
jgi:hypothetical protein